MTRMRRFFPIAFLLGTLTWSPVLVKAEQAPVPSEENVPQLPIPGIRILDVSHSYFSKNIEGLSDSVDSFFGDDRIFEEASGTYMQVRGSVIYRKNGNIDFDSRLQAKVSLTNLTDRLQFLISGDDEEPGTGSITSGGELTGIVDDVDPALSLQFLFLEKRRWDIRLQPGVKVRTPVDPFLKVRVRRQQLLSNTWLWRTTATPAWYKSRGYELSGSLDLERGTGDGGFFRATTGLYWREEARKNLLAQQSLFFSHPLGSRSQMAYETGIGFEREPHWRHTAYFATIRYRTNIHRGWIFFELKPQLQFERWTDFKPEPSLALTLELFFGSAYLR